MAQPTVSPAVPEAPRPARVLVVDGNEEHQALSVTVLGRRGFRVSVADSAREGVELALAEPFDVIVLSHRLRGPSGLEALRVLASRLPGVPKIFVVPEGSEDLAVRALREGASGFLVKTAKYHELLPAEVEEQLGKLRVHAQLRETEARYRHAIESSQIAALVVDGAGRLVAVNGALAALTGFTREELLQRTWSDLASPEDGIPSAGELFQRVAALPNGIMELTLRKKDGTSLIAEAASRTVPIGPGATGIEILLRDITDRKRVERELADLYGWLGALHEATGDAILLADRDLRPIRWNARALELFQARAETFPTRTMDAWLRDLAGRARNPEGILRTLDAYRANPETLVEGPLELVSPEPRTFWRQGIPVRNPRGELIGRLWTFRDITDRITAEESLRRRDAILDASRFAAERFLQTRRWDDAIEGVLARLGGATGVSRVWIYRNIEEGPLRKVAGVHEWVAPGVRAVMDAKDRAPRGYRETGFGRWEEILSRGGVIQGHVREFPPEEQATLRAQEIRSLVVVPIPVSDRWWGSIGFDQCDREREWTAPEIDALRTVAGILGAAIGRSLAEEALRESEARFRAIAEQTPAIVWTVDRDLRFTSSTGAALAGLGLVPGQVVGMTLQDYFGTADEGFVPFAAHLRALQGEPVTYDLFFRGRWYHSHVEPLRDASGQVSGVIGVALDISERVRSEEALRERARQQAAVARFSQQVLTGADVPSLLQAAVELVAETLRVEYVAVLDYDPSSEFLIPKAAFGWPADRLGTPLVKADPQTMAGFCVRTGMPSIANDLEKDRRFAVGAALREQGIRCGICVPLEIPGRPRAVLGAHGKTPRAFTEDDVHFLQAIANTLATAVERRRSEEARDTALRTLRAVIDSSPAAIVGVDLEGRLTLWNRAAESLFGWKAEEVLGQPLPTVPPDRAEEHQQMRKRAQAGETTWDVETRRRRKDGTLVDVSVSVSPIHDAQGTVIGTMGALMDITERKHAERLREATYRISELASQVEDLNELFAAVHGVARELLPAENFYIALYDSEDDVLSFPYFVDAKEPPPPPQKLGRGLTEYVLRTGRPLLATPEVFADLIARGEVEEVGPPSVDWLGVPLHAEGRVFGVIAVQSYTEGLRFTPEDVDVLEYIATQVAMAVQRKRAEEALRESERRYRMLFDSNPQPMWVYDAETLRFLEVNEAAIRHYGYTREEFLRMTIRDIRPPEDVPALERALAALGEGVHDSGRWRHRKKDGTLINVEIVSHPILLGGRKARLVLATDVTERRRAEEALARSEQKFRSLFEAAADAIVLVDAKANLLDVNPAAEAIAGVPKSDLIGRNLQDVVLAEDLERARAYVREVLRGGYPEEPFPVRIRTARGDVRSLEARSRAVQVAQDEPLLEIVLRDVTEEKEMQRRLVESERLASIGQISAYVAHEINNPLANIALLVALAERRTKDEEVLEKLRKIDVQRRQAANIIADLMSFSKQRPVRAAEADLRDILQAALEQVAPYRREEVSLLSEVPSHPVRALVDPLQLQEVFVNLIKNALEATTSGSVRVLLEERPGAVAVHVADTGPGIAPEVRDRLFQPFATTKGKMGGTGLGLVLCKSVVTAHGGEILVASEPGKGSTFTVVLPREGAHEDPSGR